jgi:hypothetical protein
MATTPDYTINYEDDRLNDVKLAETSQLTEDAQLGQDMLDSVDTMYDDAKAATDLWEQTQINNQKEQTNLTIQQIEQQKEQAQKDYTKEQAGAYVDWRKQSNQYGSEAEKMASAGLSNTGFSESSQVSMYNTYQNRIAVARESFNQIWTDYNNKINEAKIQNNAALAEIAVQAAQQRAEYVIQSVLQRNQLLNDIANRKIQTQQLYNDKWKTTLDVMMKENELKWQTDQAVLDREHDKKMAEINHKYTLERDEINNTFTEKMAGINHDYEIKLLDAKTAAEKELIKEQKEADLEKLKKQKEYALEELDKKLANEKALYAYQQSYNSGKFSGGGSSGSSSKTYAPAKQQKWIGKNYVDPDPPKKTSFTGSTYKEASAYLKSNGVSNGAMTESEWSRRKNSYSMTGQGAEEVKRFSTYKAYIQAYVKYRTGG